MVSVLPMHVSVVSMHGVYGVRWCPAVSVVPIVSSVSGSGMGTADTTDTMVEMCEAYT